MPKSTRLVIVLTAAALAGLANEAAHGSSPSAGSGGTTAHRSADVRGNGAISAEQPPALRYQYTFGDCQDAVGPQAAGDEQATGPDGSIYVFDQDNLRMQRLDSEGNLIAVWGRRGNGEGEFVGFSDVSLRVDGDGSITVSEIRHFRNQRFGPNGQFLGNLDAAAEGDGQPVESRADGYPGIAPGSGGLTDKREDTQLAGSQSVAQTNETEVGRMHLSRAAAPDRQGGLLVSDCYPGQGVNLVEQVVRFSSEGVPLERWPPQQNLHYVTNCAQSLEVRPDGRIYATNGLSGVSLLEPNGEYVHSWGTRGTGDSEFMYPGGIAVGVDGTLYVADTENARIQRFTASGDFIGKWGYCHMLYDGHGYPSGCRRADGEFSAPIDVGIAHDGSILVLDQGHRRVQRFSPDGVYEHSFDICGYPLSDRSPQALAVAPDGRSYVACRGRSGSTSVVAAYDEEGRPVGTAAVEDVVGLDGFPRWRLDMDTNGRLLLTLPRAVHVYGTQQPQTWRMQVFGNEWLAGLPKIADHAGDIDFNWTEEPPDAASPSDSFSVRLDRSFFFDTGRYRFGVAASGGVRLWVGKHLLVDDWEARSVDVQPELLVTSGDHRIRLEFNRSGDDARLRFSWTSVGEAQRAYLPVTAN